MSESLQLLRSRRSGEQIGFGRLAERLQAYASAHPDDEEAVGRVADFLSYVETDDQVKLDLALADTFPASDPPSHSGPTTL